MVLYHYSAKICWVLEFFPWVFEFFLEFWVFSPWVFSKCPISKPNILVAYYKPKRPAKLTCSEMKWKFGCSFDKTLHFVYLLGWMFVLDHKFESWCMWQFSKELCLWIWIFSLFFVKIKCVGIRWFVFNIKRTTSFYSFISFLWV